MLVTAPHVTSVTQNRIKIKLTSAFCASTSTTVRSSRTISRTTWINSVHLPHPTHLSDLYCLSQCLQHAMTRGPQRIFKTLDSIFSSQRCSVKNSSLHCCISDKSVLQCWSSFSFVKHCKKKQPIINQLLILEP